jgi:deoxycytidylate deaminase
MGKPLVPKHRTSSPPKTTPLVASGVLPETTLQERQTAELVIALVGPVGSGVTKTATLLQRLFEKRYKYEVSLLRVSRDIIEKSAKLLEKSIPSNQKRDERIKLLQEIGTELRHKFGVRYLAEKCVEQIAIQRSNSGFEGLSGKEHPIARRQVHIIDSLKHPDELRLLENVYGNAFWVFGVFAPEEIRKQRLVSGGLEEEQLQSIMMIDEEEGVEENGIKYGQSVRDTIHLADFFVRNDQENDERLGTALQRYLDIIFGVGINTPTQDESAMVEASSAASNSACLSRQVGAVIYSEDGELIGIGANDVPKFGGGLYGEEGEPSGKADNRCFKWDGKICHNDARKDRLYKAIYEALKAKALLASEVTLEAVMAAVKRTQVKDLIEYSRSVHAEMEAIVSVARGHKAGIVGATVYTTTFPCHSCARHIIASGIRRVVYVEPYAKSLAMELHRDAISVDINRKEDHVLFLQYEGVAPKNVLRLFRSGLVRKEFGSLKERDPSAEQPIFASPLDGFSRREELVVQKITKIEHEGESATTAGNTTSHGGIRRPA